MSMTQKGPFDGHPVTVCPEPTLARESEAAACDVNLIVKRYEKTGLLPEGGREAVFADVSEMGDFRQAWARIEKAQEAFMQLPAEVRARFENDASTFVEFCQDPENRAEMEALGLVEKAPVPAAGAPVSAPAPVPVVVPAGAITA